MISYSNMLLMTILILICCGYLKFWKMVSAHCQEQISTEV